MTLPAWLILAYLAWRVFADLAQLLLGSSWRAGQYFARLVSDVVLLALVVWTIASFAPATPPPHTQSERSIQLAEARS